jgi:hypothetical protein
MDRMVQRAASASGARRPEPAPVAGPTTSTCGLTAREHYNLALSGHGGRRVPGATHRMGRRAPVRIAEAFGARTARSALLQRRVLSPARLVPCKPEVGRTCYRAETAIQVLEFQDDPDGGSNSLRQWRRGQSNPRPGDTSALGATRHSNSLSMPALGIPKPLS